MTSVGFRSLLTAATALTVFAVAGVAGNLLGGRLADRFGPTRIAVLGFCALTPLIPGLMTVAHASVALLVLGLAGFALSTTYSPLVILGQTYLPNHVGLSAGVTLGLAITVGGLATPLLGRLADQHGLSIDSFQRMIERERNEYVEYVRQDGETDDGPPYRSLPVEILEHRLPFIRGRIHGNKQPNLRDPSYDQGECAEAAESVGPLPLRVDRVDQHLFRSDRLPSSNRQRREESSLRI